MLTNEDATNLRKLAKGEDISHIPNVVAWLLSLANAIDEAANQNN